MLSIASLCKQMKLYATALLALTAVKGVLGWKILWQEEGGRQLEGQYYSQLFSDNQDSVTACLIVKDSIVRNDQALILGDCDLPNQAWYLDSDGLYHTQLDDGYCMQAGRTGKLKHGVKMRLFECDKSKKRQQFDGIGVIHLKDPEYDHLYVEFRGAHPNVNVDPIILKDEDAAHAGWSAD